MIEDLITALLAVITRKILALALRAQISFEVVDHGKNLITALPELIGILIAVQSVPDAIASLCRANEIRLSERCSN